MILILAIFFICTNAVLGCLLFRERHERFGDMAALECIHARQLAAGRIKALREGAQARAEECHRLRTFLMELQADLSTPAPAAAQVECVKLKLQAATGLRPTQEAA